MKIKDFILKYRAHIICVALLLAVWPPHVRRSPDEGRTDVREADCAIALTGYVGTSMSLSTGFNYEMLRRAGDLLHYDMRISLADDRGAALDSLEAGVIDLAVLPFADSALAAHPGLMQGPVMADSTVWVVSGKGRISAPAIGSCLSSIRYSADYEDIIYRFTPAYEPFAREATGRTFKYASPYDMLIKAGARELGWDWRLLAALIWQESRFRIEARSRRGAEGLLQLMEPTAMAYNGSAERLDPEANLQAGVNYLRKLQRMFAGDAGSPEELTRFVLAAFNAGEGRIKDCIKIAESEGLPHSAWADIKAVFPLMEDFRGAETVRHVERTDSLYKAFCVIVP